jgi:hypothetical protein
VNVLFSGNVTGSSTALPLSAKKLKNTSAAVVPVFTSVTVVFHVPPAAICDIDPAATIPFAVALAS